MRYQIFTLHNNNNSFNNSDNDDDACCRYLVDRYSAKKMFAIGKDYRKLKVSLLFVVRNFTVHITTYGGRLARYRMVANHYKGRRCYQFTKVAKALLICNVS